MTSSSVVNSCAPGFTESRQPLSLARLRNYTLLNVASPSLANAERVRLDHVTGLPVFESELVSHTSVRDMRMQVSISVGSDVIRKFEAYSHLW